MRLISFILVIILINNLCGSEENHKILLRRKRFLIFKEGINWVQFIAGIGLPIELKDQSITVGSVFKAFYLLPTNASDYLHPSIDYSRRKRSASRWIIYNLIENFINRYGDGKACLLKSICEVSSQPFEKKSGVLAEIVHAILKPSSTRDILDNHSDSEYHAAEKLGKEEHNCAALFPECSLNIIQQFTRFLT